MTNISHAELKQKIENQLSDISDIFKNTTLPPTLSQAFAYPLAVGGKRLRPLLLMRLALCFENSHDFNSLLKKASALEMMHTYSLVHDDLPCMDNDDFRRGKPSTHKQFGVAEATLIGDALLTESFAQLAEGISSLPAGNDILPFAIRALSQSSGVQGMIAGQWIDIRQTLSTSPTFASLCEMHRLKTGCLFGCALRLGFLYAWANGGYKFIDKNAALLMAEKWNALGENLGVTFQIADDFLDVHSNLQSMGKSQGKDAAQNKVTAVQFMSVSEFKSYLKEKLTEFEKSSRDIFSHLHSLKWKNDEKNIQDFIQLVQSCFASN